MTEGRENRNFLRLVLAIAIVANSAAALVVHAERELQPYAVESALDLYRLGLTDEIATYGASVRTLLDSRQSGSEP